MWALRLLLFALLPRVPTAWEGIVTFACGAVLVLTLGGARLYRPSLVTRPDDTAVGALGAIILVCVPGVVVGIALPSGWTLLGQTAAAIVGGVIALAVGFGGWMVAILLAMRWLGISPTEDFDEESNSVTEDAVMVLGMVALPLAAEVLSPLTAAAAPEYVGGLLFGAALSLVWAGTVKLRGAIADRVRIVAPAARAAVAVAEAVRSVVGVPYRRYRTTRAERRRETEAQIETAEAAIERVDGPAQAATHAVRDARDSLEAGDHERAREFADEAVDLAAWERDLIDRIESVRHRDVSGPEHAPDRVESRLREAAEHLSSGDLQDAQSAIDDAERLVGPAIDSLVERATDAFEEATQADDPEREIGALERARDRYEDAVDRARELDECDRARDLEHTLADVEERLAAARVDHQRARLEEAATAAWDAVREGDALVDDDPSEAREAYDRAIERYAAALDLDRVTDADLEARIETAIDRLEAAETDCRRLDARRRLERTADVTPEDVPSGEAICDHVPVAEALWQAVAPEAAERRPALETLGEALRAANLRAYVDRDVADRADRAVREIDTIGPVVARYLREGEYGAELRAVALDVLRRLESQLAEAVELVEPADLPQDFETRPAAVEESYADALEDEASIAAFARRWPDAFESLTAALDTVDETATLLDAYDEVAGRIESTIADGEEVTAGALPVRRPRAVLRLYAHRHADATYDPETGTLTPE